MPAMQRRGIRHWFARLSGIAPSIVSSASDNDPTTVASLAVIGSTTVYGLGWLVLLTIPMLGAIMSISARIGAATGAGLEDLVESKFGRPAAVVLLIAVLVVNVVTLAADLEGGGAALALLSGIDFRIWTIPLAIVALALLILGNYARVEKVLVYLPLAFLAYIAAAFLAHPDWGAVLRAIVPHFEYSKNYVSGAIALLGTTLTAYAYVWQEIEYKEQRPPLRRMGLVQLNASISAIGAGLVFWFIVIATGATLGVHHKVVQTANDAAQALVPVAGRFAGTLFGIGLLGSALLAIPVLLATSAYLSSEIFGWAGKLDAQFFQARRFYGIMIAVAAVACALTFAGLAPIQLLFFSSIVGGIATPISLVFVMLTAEDRRIMRSARLHPLLRVAGWGTTGVVVLAVLAYFYQVLTGQS